AAGHAATAATPAPPLSTRMLRAAGWLVGSNLGAQALRLGSNLVLTRLLAPEAFGLVAVVNTLYFGLVMFSDLGIWQSIVTHPRGQDARFLGTAFSVQLVRAALLAVIVLGVALAVGGAAGAGWMPADSVYADPRLPWMIAAFALCALLQGAESMRLALAQRELRGRELARLELGAQIVAAAVTIVLATVTRSVAALVAGALAGAAARTLLSHVALPGPVVRPCWDRASLRELVGFGQWVFVSSIVGFLAAHGEKLILGALLVPASFGQYAIAALLVAAVAGLYGSLNGHVVFASMSQALRSDPAALRALYARVQRVADLALGGVAGLLAVAGHWIVWLLYDARYQGAGAVLQALGLGLVAMRHQVVEQVMFAMGQPARVSANNLLRAAALVVLVPAGHAVAGERGAVAGVVIAQFAAWPASLHFKHRQGLLSWDTERAWMVALVIGLGLGAVVDVALHHALGR
ncbi:MAG: oligosaccharide flippase family protein, partial [Rhodoferax sp.]|nr:oligosaccharide flippase family protein [Rhodoferax sp.]